MSAATYGKLVNGEIEYKSTPVQQEVKPVIATKKATVHLQYCGDYEGTPAGDLKVGDKLMWNFGAVCTITAIEKRGKSVYVTEHYTNPGREYTGVRRMLATRLVARI